jgi:hypothetical protein
MITTAKVLAYPAKAMIHAGYAVGEKVVEGVSHLASSKRFVLFLFVLWALFG